MASIPELLTERLELLQHLDNANDLLEAIRSSDTGMEAEKGFLQDKIDSIERVLCDGEDDAARLINELQYDPVAWTAARLRFMHGYTWKTVGTCIGLTEETARIICLRRFRQIPKAKREGWKRVMSKKYSSRVSEYIPSVLLERFALLRLLHESYVLLDNVIKSNAPAEEEIRFVQARIAAIEAEIESTWPETDRVLNLMIRHNESIAWSVSWLRFVEGYTWEDAAATVGVNSNIARIRVYRFFKSGREAAEISSKP